MNINSLPNKNEFPEYFNRYIDLVHETDYAKLITEQNEQLLKLFLAKDSTWFDQAYQAGKWTPKEVLGHIIDTERIMAFRALCFARGEKSSLPGFDHNAYATHAQSAALPIEELIEDFLNSRKALLSMVKTLPNTSLENRGEADGNAISVRALLWIIPGHLIHHLTILKNKY